MLTKVYISQKSSFRQIKWCRLIVDWFSYSCKNFNSASNADNGITNFKK